MNPNVSTVVDIGHTNSSDGRGQYVDDTNVRETLRLARVREIEGFKQHQRMSKSPFRSTDIPGNNVNDGNSDDNSDSDMDDDELQEHHPSSLQNDKKSGPAQKPTQQHQQKLKWHRPRTRRLAYYNDELVLLDPKDYDEDETDDINVSDLVYERVKTLAQVLNRYGPTEFQSLRCKGWFEDVASEQFYFVYEIPFSSARLRLATSGGGVAVGSGTDLTFPDSLLDYISSSFRPSLSQRIELARVLAEALVRIHRLGWMHKGIRSENVIFLTSLDRGRMRSLAEPRLIGFDFARKEGVDEYSEKPM